MKAFLARYQEVLLWLPGLILLAVGGVIVFGGMAGGLGPDLLAWLAELPIFSGYAFAALGLSYVAWRRWRFRLSESQTQDLWERLMRGERGAIIVFVVNAIFYLAVLWLALDFFRPSR